MAHSLREWYLHLETPSHKTIHAGSADYYTPATLLGLIVGWILARHTRVELVFWVLLLSGGIVILAPLYATFFPKGALDGLTPSLVIGILPFKYITVVINCGMCAFAAWVFTRNYNLQRNIREAEKRVKAVSH